MIITCRINQLRSVAKRDNLYTLSLFALKLCLFRLKCILKLRKHTFEKVFSTLAGRANPPHTADVVA